MVDDKRLDSRRVLNVAYASGIGIDGDTTVAIASPGTMVYNILQKRMPRVPFARLCFTPEEPIRVILRRPTMDPSIAIGFSSERNVVIVSDASVRG